MDFHFVTPKISENNNSSREDFKKILKLLRNFIPVFLLAAMLPAFLAILVSPPDIGFISRADTDPILRIWMEPATTLSSPGKETTVKIFADFQSDSLLIPEISFTISPEEPLIVSQNSFTRSIPFKGKTELGSFTLSSQTQTDSSVSVNESSITITAFDSPLEIDTSPARLIVR